MNIKSKFFALSLLDIASWTDRRFRGSYPEMKVAVPTLQRGLAWQPQQIELLWDSIFRGFPVGSFVLCPKIEGQERLNDRDITHHLLDGQQRCDAIRMGFHDVYSSEPAPVGESVLWLDLNPELDQHSTRSFLFRLTNVGHPWGYAKNDASSTLQAWEVRAALSSVGLNPVDEGYQRPVPYLMSPYQAACPVPLSWLLEAYRGGESMQHCWELLQQRLAFEARPTWMAENGARPLWAETAQAFFNDASESAMAQREFLFKGLKRAMDTAIFGLLAPDIIMHSSRLEPARGLGDTGISHVEQLFQRLNRQGTRLDGEELAYSMIKAYWPELAEPIESLHVKRMPASRLVALGVRASLTLADKKSEALHGSLSVSQIRRIATDRGVEAVAIQEFIKQRLGPACEFIERILVYEPRSNSSGLLPVHLATMAKESPDLYLLLIIIADQLLSRELEDSELGEVRQALLSLTMRVRWFSLHPVVAIQSMYRTLAAEGINTGSLERSIKAAIRRGELMDLPSVEEVRSFVNFSPIPSLKDWTWSGQFELLRASAEEPGDVDRWEAFLHKLMNSRELLLYAQREYVAERFADYDPSQRDYWMGHNRPWDFDHLHAAKYVSNLKRKEKPYLDFAKQWVHTIGNLRAWPFEDNRSDHADPATVKFLANEATAGRKLKQSFLQYEEIEAFAGGYVMLHEQDLALKFATTVMRRMIRIYSECYRVAVMVD